MPSIDPILETLVRAVERQDKDGKTTPVIPLFLQVNGMIVMGNLISSRQFFESCKPLLKTIAETIEAKVEDLLIDSGLSYSDLSASPPQFIHLKEVVFAVPGGGREPENSTEFWRGRLDRVDGFVLGDYL